MGWLKNILKGSSPKTREGRCRCNDQTTWERARNSESSSDFDKEEIDRAIELSIAEEEERGEKVMGEQVANGLQEEYDLLDKANQENLNADSPPQSPLNHHKRTCPGCNSEIDDERYSSSSGSLWHQECLRCHSCKHPIYDQRFSENEFFMPDNLPYHKSCYMEQYYLKCDVCRNFIRTTTTNAAGLQFECGGHRFWPQKYCLSHNHDGTPRCCSCERLEQPIDARYLTLEDERKLCLECLDSSIMDNLDSEQLYLEVQQFYQGINMKLEQPIPLLLVKKEALNEAMEGPETRGLCLSEVQNVSAISRWPRIGAYDHTEPYMLDRKCEVIAILVLYGLPRLLTGSILVHEMMHAWLRLKGYQTLSPNVEEGICQVLAHRWLESEVLASSATNMASTSSSSSSPSTSNLSTTSSSEKGKWSEFEKKLCKFFIYKIESDPSETYGDGFREGNKAVITYGLKRTLDHIMHTGCFP